MTAGFASSEPASISGTVRDSHGVPQIGATVELLRSDSSVIATVFTDEHGRFQLSHLFPGTYSLKATGTLFLPTLRENLQVFEHTRTAVNLTLSTLVEAFQWLPAQRRNVNEPDDDWAWTLRSAANRPLLRMLEDGPLVVVSEANSAPALKARVTLHGGANEFGEGGLHHAFEIEQAKGDDRRLILRADFGSSETASIASAQTMAAYEQQIAPGRTVRTVASFQNLPQIETGAGVSNGLESLITRSAETLDLAPSLEAEAGNEFELVRSSSTRYANHPFASLMWHTGDQTIGYRVATSRTAQRGEELDQESSVASNVAENAGAIELEQALHQELSFEDSTDRLQTRVVLYHDRIAHPVVSGGGQLTEADLRGGNAIYDPLTELIQVAGNNFSSTGVIAGVKSKIAKDTWLGAGLADGDALATPIFLALPTLSDALAQLSPRHAQMYSVSITSRIAESGTAWRASYRWQPSNTVTAIAPFDTNAPDAYLSFFIRQPLRCGHMLPDGMEALVDVRNLLAQGYRPFVTRDGSVLYFAQADRSIRGGLSFSF